MNEDREQSGARTEEELANQRQLRFGHLPARVRPDDVVESAETDPAREEPSEPMVRREWG